MSSRGKRKLSEIGGTPKRARTTKETDANDSTAEMDVIEFQFPKVPVDALDLFSTASKNAEQAGQDLDNWTPVAELRIQVGKLLDEFSLQSPQLLEFVLAGNNLLLQAVNLLELKLSMAPLDSPLYNFLYNLRMNAILYVGQAYNQIQTMKKTQKNESDVLELAAQKLLPEFLALTSILAYSMHDYDKIDANQRSLYLKQMFSKLQMGKIGVERIFDRANVSKRSIPDCKYLNESACRDAKPLCVYSFNDCKSNEDNKGQIGRSDNASRETNQLLIDLDRQDFSVKRNTLRYLQGQAKSIGLSLASTLSGPARTLKNLSPALLTYGALDMALPALFSLSAGLLPEFASGYPIRLASGLVKLAPYASGVIFANQARKSLTGRDKSTEAKHLSELEIAVPRSSLTKQSIDTSKMDFSFKPSKAETPRRRKAVKQ